VDPAVSFISLDEKWLSLEVKSRGQIDAVWWSVIGNVVLEAMILMVPTMCYIVAQGLVVFGCLWCC
jgi:hypothetical protein